MKILCNNEDKHHIITQLANASCQHCMFHRECKKHLGKLTCYELIENNIEWEIVEKDEH